MADTILSLLEPGEYVLNRNAVDKLGKKTLDNINYKQAPRFPNKSILADYFNNQDNPNFWSGVFESFNESKKTKGGSKKKSTPPQDIDLRGKEEEMGFGEGEDIEIPAHILQKYQDGGSVSYGGYESTTPTLESLYEMFGIQPNLQNEKRFKEYDPSREGVHKEDYQTALDKLKRTSSEAIGDVYEETAGAGGFSGSGAADKARQKARGSIMDDYIGGQQGAFSTLFKGVRDEREKWLREQGQMLSTLEGAGGTNKYKVGKDDPTHPEYIPDETPGWTPPAEAVQGDTYQFDGDTFYMYFGEWIPEKQWQLNEQTDS